MRADTPPRPPRGDVPPIRIAPLPRDVGPDEAKETDSSVLAVGYDATKRPAGLLRLGGFRKARAVDGTVIGKTAQADGAYVGLSKSHEVRHFGHLRHLALLGVHVAVVYGDEVSTTLLKARACENRIFVLALLPDGWSVIDPRGQVVRAGPWPARADGGEIITLDVAQAADKEVAPRTNTLTGRRPGQYLL